VTGLMGTRCRHSLTAWRSPKTSGMCQLREVPRPDKPNFATILPVRPVQGEIPDDPAAAFWAEQAPANFPLAGQVTVTPEIFTPSIDMITVRAVYSDSEIAFPSELG